MFSKQNMAPIHLRVLLASLALLYSTTAVSGNMGMARSIHMPIEARAAIGINTNVKVTERKMPLGVNSFLDLISTGVFVDKTLLIHDMLSKVFSRTIILCPNRWGKTINLDMLETFVRMQVHPNGTRMLPITSTPNYQLFMNGEYHSDQHDIKLETPLLISEKQCIPTVNEYLGQHPVIHLSFAGVKPIMEKEFSIGKLGPIISKAFKQHEYMLQLYDAAMQQNCTYEKTRATDNKKKFLSFMKGTQKGLETSIQFLGKELYDHYERPVFIFIDEYDRILDIKNREKKVDLFFAYSLQYGQHLKRAILTGTLPLELDIEDIKLNEFLDTPYHHYYGFNTDEMSLLYRYFQIPTDEQRKIRYWYGGYQTFINVEETLFYPWSICNYMLNRKFVPYVEPLFDDTHLNDTFNLPLFQYTFGRLIAGRDYDVEYLLFADQQWHTFDVVKAVRPGLRHLHATGHLITKSSFFQPESNIRRYTVPNFEMSVNLHTMFASKLHLFYGGTTYGVLKKTATFWERYVAGDLSTQEFQEQIQKCHVLITIYNNLPMRNVMAATHMVVVSIVPSGQFHFISWQFEYTTKVKNQELPIPPDVIVLTSASRGVIIDITYHDNTSLTTIKETRVPFYLNMFREYPTLHHWKDIKFVFLNTKPNERIEVQSTLHTL